jgi:hypothetical protein
VSALCLGGHWGPPKRNHDERYTLRKRNKNYVSEIDLFLAELRQAVPESESQNKEREEYEHLNRLRDQASSER